MFFRSRESRRLATRAAQETSELGRRRIPPEHFLLALLDPQEETPASRALQSSGAEHDKLRDALVAEARDGASESSETADGVSPTAGAYQMIGRAEGLATGLGERAVRAEHVLLALLPYAEDSYIAFRLRQAGGSREAAWGQLRRQGTDIPDLDLPPLWGVPLPP